MMQGSLGSGGLCRVCGHVLRKWRRTWLGFEWGECRRCGSQQKIITESEYLRLEPTYDPGFSPHHLNMTDLLQQLNVKGKRELLERMFGSPVGGSLLDIGCGMGGVLVAARQMGMDAFGVEPSASHSKAAVDLFGLDVANGYFEKGFVERKFDFIVLSHVIEHIYLPRYFLADVMDALAPGGKLLMITPNTQSLAAKACGRFWSMYKPVDHVTLIGSSGIKFLIPPGAAIERLETDEWSGEFASHIVSAIKTMARPALANVAGAASSAPKMRSTMGWGLRLVLAVTSLPFTLLGAILDRRSCLYVVIKKSRGADESR